MSYEGFVVRQVVVSKVHDRSAFLPASLSTSTLCRTLHPLPVAVLVVVLGQANHSLGASFPQPAHVALPIPLDSLASSFPRFLDQLDSGFVSSSSLALAPVDLALQQVV